jgi:hypothetical protein
MPYPVSLTVESRLDNRDRLTTAVRPILAIPHAILVGPPMWWTRGLGTLGFLGGAAYVLAIVSWFTLLVNGEQSAGIRDFMRYYLRWRTRALAYMALFADAYPPFGDAAYPASIEIADPAQPRDRASIAVRLLLALPHLVLLALLLFAWLVTTVLAWFAILLTGSYPAALHPFGVGVMRWLLRVEAYVLLLVDEYPPFALD